MSTKTRSATRALAAGAGALAILFTSACGGSGEGSPEDLGKAVAKAITDKDVETAKSLTCAAQQDKVEQEFDYTKNLPANMKDVKPVAEFSNVENATDDSATLKIKIKLENMPPEAAQLGLGEGIDIPLKAIKEDGNWVVCE